MAMIAIPLRQLVDNNRKDIEKYACPRCDHLLRDAVQQMCCGHWLCECCAKQLAKEVTPLCPRPDCLEPWNGDEEPPFFPDRFVRKLLGKLLVKCFNSGCNWTGAAELLKEHIILCAYAKVQCQTCEDLFSVDELKTHRDVCQGALKFCFFSDLGCDHKTKMTSEELVSHLTVGSNIVKHLEIIARCLKNAGATIAFDEVEKDGLPDKAGICLDPKLAFTRSAAPTPVKNGLISKFRAVVPDGPEGTEYHGATAALSPYGSHPSQEMLNELLPPGKQLFDILQQFVECKAEVESLKKLLVLKDTEATKLVSKVSQLEKAIQSKSSEGEDRDFRLSLIENINYDGTMIWKIPQFSQRMEDARSGKYTSIFSLPFYSGRYGYKMCLRLYILGDGIGKNTHMSLFFVVMKGEFDAILQWPFTHKVSFRLINQHHGRDIVDVFQPDPLSSSFQRPKTDMNVASGCPRFISLAELNQGGFIEDNTIFIKVKVDVSTIKHP